MSPEKYCQQKAAKSGSNFYYSFLFLPKKQRQAIMALYAYCREIDDVVDECTDVSVARNQLAWWRNEVNAMMEGMPTHPVTIALYPHMDSFSLNVKYLHALIDGMEMDLETTEYADYESLKNYCWHVASVVGIMTAGIFGYSRPETLQYAEKLGLAFQMTNIIRDVREDLHLGRIYLPADELMRCGVSREDLLNFRHTHYFVDFMKMMAKRTHAIYDEAFALLPKEDRKAQRPGLFMALIYRTLLRRIEEDGFKVLEKKKSLSLPHKLWLAGRAYFYGR